MVDVEILVGEDGSLLDPPLKESWVSIDLHVVSAGLSLYIPFLQ